VVGLLRGDDGRVGNQGEMDPGVGHQIGLELSEIHVESTIEPQGSRDRGDNLADQPVQVGVGWPLNVQVAAADVVDCFVVNHEGTVRVLQGGVSGQDGVVGLDHGSGDLGGRVDGKLQFGFLAVVHREPLHEKGSKARAGAATEGVEKEEALESSASISQLPDPVKD